MSWVTFDNGTTIGQVGTGDGVIIQDIEYPGGARITLEENSPMAPYSITCNIYGWMAHVRTYESREAAEHSFREMQRELTSVVPKLPTPTDPNRDQRFEQALLAVGRFVDRFS